MSEGNFLGFMDRQLIVAPNLSHRLRILYEQIPQQGYFLTNYDQIFQRKNPGVRTHETDLLTKGGGHYEGTLHILLNDPTITPTVYYLSPVLLRAEKYFTDLEQVKFIDPTTYQIGIRTYYADFNVVEYLIGAIEGLVERMARINCIHDDMLLRNIVASEDLRHVRLIDFESLTILDNVSISQRSNEIKASVRQLFE